MNITTLFDETANEGLNQTLNGTINDETYIPYVERPETYIVPVLFFLIVIVGVLGNGTLVVIFVRHRNMRNVPNTYILSLALADLLVIITSVPFTSVIYTLESWPWGELICKISETAKDISTAVSIFTLTALSADRFFAIVDPLKKFHASGGGKRATRVTLCTAFSIWILAIVCAIPAAIGSHIKGIPAGNAQFFVCYPFPEHWLNDKYPQVMVMGKFLLFYIVPLAIIGIFYLSMAAALMLSAKNMPGELQGMQRQMKARKKVAVTVLIFVVVFAIFFAPLHAFMLFFYFNPDSLRLYNAFWHYLRIVGFCLYYSHSCANPIALYFVSGAFRKYYKRYLLCKKQNPRYSGFGNQASSMTMVSMKRGRSINRTTCRLTPTVIQETSVNLLGNGNGHHVCSKIR
nr:unnamed protein product [Callosobruchus analis]